MRITSRISLVSAIFLLFASIFACSVPAKKSPSVNTTREPSSPFPSEDSSVSFSSGRIIFSADPLPGPGTFKGPRSIFSMKPDGTDIQPITSDSEDVQFFSVSPDNKKIAIFSTSLSSGDSSLSIWDGSESRVEITREEISDIDWSPCGDQLAFVKKQEDLGDIFSVNVNGADSLNLTNTPDQDDSNPHWSPDCRKIVYESQYIPPHSVVYRDSYGTQLFIVNSDGSDNKLVTNFPQAVNTQNTEMKINSFAPDWAPDSQRLAFISNVEGEAQLYMIDTESPQTTSRISLKGQANLRIDYLYQPSWSPDGKNILFGAYTMNPGAKSIYLANEDGGEINKVIDRTKMVQPPQWSPDGKWIAFLEYIADQVVGIYIIRPNGSDLKLITNFPDKSVVQFFWR